MLQGLSQKFRGGCMMLLRDDGQQVAFLGTAFLVDSKGYLLTAAHLVNNPENLRVAPTDAGDGFIPMTFDRVAAMPVRVSQLDAAHGTALLKLELEENIDIGVPDDFLGTAENVRPGASIMSLGYAFGHDQLHTILTVGGFVAAKILTPNGTNLILFDNMAQDGDVGGPLVHAADGHIVGLVSGRFEPAEVARGSTEWDRKPPRDTNISYAVAIDYGIALMEKEGLHEQVAG
ncbi:peptidase Do [Thiorhodovibrio winogradskyi]|uniref:Peptidase Do n=1 Tax=Thiorhodovibrio winogradskyi TaxID=77007 RepID=A0ABZ0SEC6_9GAMM|nr:serine protease [Thiorhodovibrio winogradskyi]